MAWEHDLVSRLTDAQGRRGAAKPVIQEFQTLTGKSPQQLYRIAKANGYRPERKRRADAGECSLTEGQVSWVSAQVGQTAREIKGCIMPVEVALQNAFDNGIIDRGAISVSRMTEILRERGMNRKHLDAPEPHIRLRSLHPNHVHIFDMSVCIQFYLKGRLRMMREDLFYKNKPGNFAKIKRKLIRYVIADHFSHAIFPWYAYAAGENQEDLFEFLCRAWGHKGEKFPFRGVPKYVLMDAGAANMSHAIKALLKSLEIEIPASLPHNPRRQGSAEVTQNIVEGHFESNLRIQSATGVEELNVWALDWATWFNATRAHSRHGMTRSACWMQITSEQLRELPGREVLNDLFSNPSKECRVYGDYTIRFKGEVYSVRHVAGVMPNLSKVSVTMRPYTWPEVAVKFQDEEYLLQPLKREAGGFLEGSAIIGQEFKAVPESPAQVAKKRAENMAYGEDVPKKSEDRVPFRGIVVMGNKAEQVDVDYIPRKGVVHPASARSDELRERSISMMEFIQKRLLPVVGKISPDINRALRDRFGSSISLADANRIVEAARAGRLTESIAEEAHEHVATTSAR